MSSVFFACTGFSLGLTRGWPYYKLKIVPWKRAIAETRSGRYHGAIGASKTDAQGFVFPEEELARNVLSFYIKKDAARQNRCGYGKRAVWIQSCRNTDWPTGSNVIGIGAENSWHEKKYTGDTGDHGVTAGGG